MKQATCAPLKQVPGCHKLTRRMRRTGSTANTARLGEKELRMDSTMDTAMVASMVGRRPCVSASQPHRLFQRNGTGYNYCLDIVHHLLQILIDINIILITKFFKNSV
ncbi:unnamed protein product [Plutella xylostella]|uniref:(diamondback moth) hypothetical protein n=1 Tax=Plutella xylostella TaxID=51655 RepID=A0A8S4EZ38_PLUXY|nr:unnamed protein product [Plutella xylostella]